MITKKKCLETFSTLNSRQTDLTTYETKCLLEQHRMKKVKLLKLNLQRSAIKKKKFRFRFSKKQLQKSRRV
ncbi:CLUMA_CG003660, isoform A [Clunio marinus]|uniref:CLUMA_CG003660, isoform A n=1 Tax=Clunio marinus TaxID=568069 RepID=A0A1J1HQW5_9DIPT|nr:CLUMA_CG003660, isoform A [Clunio marinus]